MRGARLTRRSALVILGLSFLGGFLVASQTAAQYPTSPYPTSPSPGPSLPKGASVRIGGTSISNYSFHPRTLKVKRGAKVTWRWQSNAPHNITFRKLGKHSHTGASETFKLSFTKRGTFHYLCTVHGFTAKIVVK
jgi:plastocyanin